jgi:hypothetical protein
LIIFSFENVSLVTGKMMFRTASKLAAIALMLSSFAVPAQAEPRQGGKLLLTGGVSSIEGSGGGGLGTWALITGYGTADGNGLNTHATLVQLPDFQLRTYGFSFGVHDRFEASIARQEFDTGAAGAKLGLGRGFVFGQDVLGLKVRLAGDAVFDQDRVMPQIAAGLQYKTANRGAVISAIGGRDHADTEAYLAATKIFLNQSLVVNGTVRWTRANQTGLLGFGGDLNDRHRPEFRTKPDNLGFAKEQDAADLFAAFAVNKNLSVTAAYVDLGSIATLKDQRGVYLSLQAGF